MKSFHDFSRRCVLKIAIGFAVAMSMTLAVPAYACERGDLQRTYQIIHASLMAGYQCGLGKCDFNRMYALSAQSQQLPRSCQQLIESVGSRLKQSIGTPGTHCYGGVCCNQTGCVGG